MDFGYWIFIKWYHTSLQGVSFSHTSDHEGDAFISEKYSLRRVDTSLNVTDRDHSIVLTLRKEREEFLANGTISRLVKIKVDHPTDDNLRMEIKVTHYLNFITVP